MNEVIVVLGCRLDIIQQPNRKRIVGPGHDLDKRIEKAVDLYNGISHSRKIVIASGGDPQGHGATEAEVISELMSREGVPKKNIIEENHSVNTIQNALYSGSILHLLERSNSMFMQSKKVKIHVVTSDYHIARVKAIFAFFGYTDRYDCYFVSAKSNAPDLSMRISHENRINVALTLKKYNNMDIYSKEACGKVSGEVSSFLRRTRQ